MILVTGGAGFIGSNVVACLNDAGRDDVVICDRLGSGEKWRNLGKRSFADFIQPEALTSWLHGSPSLQAVIHMGAISATTVVDGDAMIQSNFSLSLRLLDHCTERGIPFLYASSAAVYGDGEQSFVDDNALERVKALRPLNLYGWSKRQFDIVVADRMARGVGLPPRCTGFRFFNVFGPNEDHKGDMKSVVAKLFPAAASGERVSLFRSHREGVADGEQRRDFIYVEDAVSVIMWALGPHGRSGIFNVGTGQARSFCDLTRAVFAALGVPERIDYIDMPVSLRDRYQYFTEASLGHLRRAGYAMPFTPLEQAVAHYVQVYLGRPDRYR
jgi:ADP-L-glycero-D-manno-heptose 6-epimerase